MKKVPYETFLKYLILARNNYSSIVSYVKAYKFGDINGRYLRRLEKEIASLATDDEFSYIENTREVKAKSSKTVIDMDLIIPDEMSRLKKELGFEGSPFDNSSVKFILENIMLRRTVEVYLTTRMDLKEILELVNNRFRLELAIEDLEAYEYWAYDITEIAPDDLYKYFGSLDNDEQEYKYMAFMNKEDFVKWKMGDECEIDPRQATMRMMVDALNSFKEVLSMSPPNHSAAKTWSDIYFKCMDHLESGSDTKDSAVFKRFNFKMVKNEDSKPIKFSELIGGKK
jgi:hypothetical protein